MNPIKKSISERVQVCGRKKGHVSLASKTEKRDDIYKSNSGLQIKMRDYFFFLISQPNHKQWVLKRLCLSPSNRSFKHPKVFFNLMDKNIITFLHSKFVYLVPWYILCVPSFHNYATDVSQALRL